MNETNSIQDQVRAQLTRAILAALNSWPEIDRRVFIMAHYSGRSIENISHTLEIAPREIQKILRQCDRRLRNELKIFRRKSVATHGGCASTWGGCGASAAHPG